MSFFLTVKQFVDVLYQFKILDYGMVVFAVGLLCYKVVKDKFYIDIKQKICVADIMVVFLTVFFTFSFLRDMSFYASFFKITSAWLVYFLGRVYGEQLLEYGKYLGIVGYVVIYANLLYRMYLFGGIFVEDDKIGLLDTGSLYYYKTDLAVGIIIASVFVYIYGKNQWIKWFTLIPVIGYIIFYSKARMGMITLVIEYALIAFVELNKRKKIQVKYRDIWRKIFIVGIWGVVFVVLIGIQTWVKGNTTFKPYRIDENGNIPLLERIFHSRHVIWWEVSQYFSEQSFFTRLVGIDLGTEYLHNEAAAPMHSLYFKILYSVGYLGVIVFTGFATSLLHQLSKSKSWKLTYLTLAFFIVFAIIGITAESIASTQMSWFMMLYAGAVFSTTEYKTGETMDE